MFKGKLRVFVLMILGLIMGVRGMTQQLVPGYYLSASGDSVEARIKFSKGVFNQVLNDFFKRVETVDSAGQEKTFTPTDIQGFAFLYNGKRYLFFSKPTKDGSLKFLSPFYLGERSSLYQYGSITSTGGGMSSKQVFYTFEKKAGQYLFLKNILNKDFRSQVREFYKEFPKAVELIDNRLKYWLDLDKDLRDILQVVNEG